MNTEDLHAEIQHTRAALMEECGGDLKRFGDLRRAGEARWAEAGHPVVSFVGQPLRELPPGVPPYRGEGEDNEILREIRATRAIIAQEAGYDTQRLFEQVREQEREAAARGVKFVSFAKEVPVEESCILREEPPKA